MLMPRPTMPLVQPKLTEEMKSALIPAPTWTPPRVVPMPVLGGNSYDSGFINNADPRFYVPPPPGEQPPTMPVDGTSPLTMQATVDPRTAQGGTVMNMPTIQNNIPAVQNTQQTVAERTVAPATIIDIPNPNDQVAAPPPPGIFTGLNQPVAGAVNQTIEDMATGKITDPFAAGQREARARQEANARASNANRISSAGFSGTGIGQQLGSAQDNQIQKNRFDSEVGVEQMRNENRVAGVNLATTVGQAQQQDSRNALSDASEFGSDADVISAYKRAYGKDLDPAAVEEFRGAQRTQRAQTIESKRIEMARGALNDALDFGSDADVIAAYKQTYGKYLDPAAVSEFRGAQRTQRAQTIESNKIALETLKSSTAGSTLAKNVLNHASWAKNPEEAWADPSFVNDAQKAWEAAGQTGTVPKDWALKQLAAITDPNLTNPILYQQNLIDQMPDDVWSPEEKTLAKKVAAMGGFDMQNWTTDPVTGKLKYTPTSTGTTVNVNGDGKEVKPPDVAGLQPGDTKLQDGNVYAVDQTNKPVAIEYDGLDPWSDDSDKIVAAGQKGNNSYDKVMQDRVSSIQTAPNLNNLASLKKDSPEYYKKAIEGMEEGAFSYNKSYWGTDTVSTNLREGNITKIKVGDKYIPVKVTVIGKFINDLKADSAYMEFQDDEGNFYHVGGYKAGERGSPWVNGGSFVKTGKTTHYDHVRGGNKNIS